MQSSRGYDDFARGANGLSWTLCIGRELHAYSDKARRLRTCRRC